MRLLRALWQDEHGVILSAEMVLIGTLGVVGATVGLSAIAQSVGDEMTDLARSFRSLDQSFHVEGVRVGKAWTAGSSFQQEPVEVSLKRLDADIERMTVDAEERADKAAAAQKKEAEKRALQEKKTEEMKAEPKKAAPKKEAPRKKKPKDKDRETAADLEA